ncbi:hypothetical protein FTUN_6961 [Frigoriglobus tundricola]|uniref:Uncharacterized protein n=1 Tax=Frigoriglobus tundricola TaxID=2774151 RepID=A0A6M5Z1J3_9BACT|nr:hypothetical protein FTUN_6961 [Frigoriglobus tundricola]
MGGAFAQQLRRGSAFGARSLLLLELDNWVDFSQQLPRAFGFSGAVRDAQQQPAVAFVAAAQEHAVPPHEPGAAVRVSVVKLAAGNATAGVN